jgi:hypothetical protein
LFLLIAGSSFAASSDTAGTEADISITVPSEDMSTAAKNSPPILNPLCNAVAMIESVLPEGATGYRSKRRHRGRDERRDCRAQQQRCDTA